MNTARKMLSTAAAGLALLSLGACNSSSHSCKNGTCTVSLAGKGTSTKVDSLGIDVRLNSAEGGKADVQVGKANVQCGQGEVKKLNDATVTCQEVGDNKVKLQIATK